MNRQEFDQLVREVEAGVGRTPAALRRRVLKWTLIGYAGLLGSLAAPLALAAVFFSGFFWADAEGKVICAIAGIVVAVGVGGLAVRSLTVHFSPPEGWRLTPQTAPELFAELEAIRTTLNAMRFHRVLLTAEHNAGVVQVPRLGLLGWSRNYLFLGLPLMEGLSRDEMRAVLAHEFAHLSRQDNRFTHGIYRLRRSWERAFQELFRSGSRTQFSYRRLLAKYIEWFWPRFNAHAFVLSRAQEYAADAASAQLVGPNHTAAALVRLQVITRQLDDHFWPELWKKANESAEPPLDVAARVHVALRTDVPAADLASWQHHALQVVTTNADTHPCLRERLDALGTTGGSMPIVAQIAAQPTAGEVFFGSRLAEHRRGVSEQWRKTISSSWRERHARASALSRRLDAIEGTSTATRVDADQLWDKALISLDLHGKTSAEPLLRQILAAKPDHPTANFQLGRILLDRGDAEGETFIERAIAHNDELTRQAAACLHQYYRSSGNTEKLRQLAARLDRYEQEAVEARKERAQVNGSDALIPHQLTDEELDQLRDALRSEPGAVRADLAQKQLRYFPQRRLFVLCVHRLRPWHGIADTSADRDLARRLAQKVRLPGQALVCPPSGSFRALARAVRRVPGATVWTCSTVENTFTKEV